MGKGKDIKIIWGGKFEKDGRRHGQYQAERRGMTIDQITAAIKQPDRRIRQSSQLPKPKRPGLVKAPR